MVMRGAVPLNGFWNTRPMNFARRCSGQRVMSVPSSTMEPSSTMNEPASALSSVDLPEPLVPMTTTNVPSSSARFTPCSARTSLGVSGLNVLRIVLIASIALPRLRLTLAPRCSAA